MRNQHFFVCSCARCEEFDKLAESEQALQEKIEIQIDLFEQNVIILPLYELKDIGSAAQELLKQYTEIGKGLSADFDPHLKARACRNAIQAASTCIEVLQASKSKLRGKLRVFVFKFLNMNIELLNHQYLYLGRDHVDLIATIHDISESMNGLLLQDPEYLVPELSKNHSFATTKTSILEKCQEFQSELYRLKLLYNRRKKFPDSFQAMTGPGCYFWGQV